MSLLLVVFNELHNSGPESALPEHRFITELATARAMHAQTKLYQCSSLCVLMATLFN